MNAKSTSLLTHAPKHLGVVLLLLLQYQNLCLAGGGGGGGATPRIVGGGKARRGDYPFFGESLEESFVWTSQSSLRTLFYVVNIYFLALCSLVTLKIVKYGACGATLVHSDIALTAAHVRGWWGVPMICGNLLFIV